MDELSQAASQVTLMLHWRLGGTAQTIVSIAKCLSELDVERLPATSSSLLFYCPSNSTTLLSIKQHSMGVTAFPIIIDRDFLKGYKQKHLFLK